MPLGHAALVLAAGRQPDGNPAAPIHNVLVGYHQPALIDYEAAPLAGPRDDLRHAWQRVLRHVCNG